MADLIGLQPLQRRLDKINHDVLSGKAARDTANKVGLMAKGKTTSVSGPAALGGDLAFSGWRRNAPIPLAAAYALHTSNDGGVTIHRGYKSAGVWRVATVGRNKGNGGGGAFAGPGVSPDGGTTRTKSGKLRKVRARKARRWNGYTSGFGTWDQFEDAVLRDVMPTVAKNVRTQLNRAVIG